jgi:hypothetical protein
VVRHGFDARGVILAAREAVSAHGPLSLAFSVHTASVACANIDTSERAVLSPAVSSRSCRTPFLPSCSYRRHCARHHREERPRVAKP